MKGDPDFDPERKHTALTKRANPSLTWQAARKCARAYLRVLNSQPRYPKDLAKFLADLAADRATFKKLRSIPRARKPGWWEEKFADVVERRGSMTAIAGGRKDAYIKRKARAFARKVAADGQSAVPGV